VPLTLVVSEPIETKGMTMKQADALTAALQERIEGLYYEHSWLERPPGSGQRTIAAAEPGGIVAGQRKFEAVTIQPDRSEEAGKR
jgi:hypothetical protein